MSESNYQETVTERRVRRRTSVAWATNVLLLVLVGGWILLDGRAFPKLQAFPRIFDGRVLGVAYFVWVVSFLRIAVGMYCGPRQFRSLRAWFAVTALLSAWLALIVAWPALYHLGQAVRLWWDVPAYETLVAELRDDWPGEDGKSPKLGYFLAYPVGKPRTLMLVGAAPVDGAAPIALVERSDQGAIRLQLAGAETGTWLEWHPEGSIPETFVGGLENRNELIRQTQLRPHWYLVRYRGSVNPN